MKKALRATANELSQSLNRQLDLSMSERPKISVVTPSFNQDSFLERTICSVLNQNYPNLEYIIIDGGSSDESVDIIKRYSHRLKYWVSEPDKGQTDAIVKGFSHATGEILAYLNSDDIFLPGTFEMMAQALDIQKPQWAVGWQQIIDENDRLIARRPVYPFTISDIWFNRYLVPQECTFFTRRMYDYIGGLDRSYHYAMDMHAWLKMASVTNPILLKSYAGCFRAHSSQKTVNMEGYFAEGDKALEDVKKWRIEKGMPPLPRPPFFRGKMHRMAKAFFYLCTGGPGVLKEIYDFKKHYRSQK